LSVLIESEPKLQFLRFDLVSSGEPASTFCSKHPDRAGRPGERSLAHPARFPARESISSAWGALKTVNAGLAGRAALLPFDETLPQSLSGSSCRRIIAAVWGFSMSSPAVATVSVRNALNRFRRNRRGSAAVEFALVAPLFFCVLFAILETAIVFFAGSLLEQGTQDTARKMLTHEAQDTGMTETAFKTELCNRIKVMFNCDGNLGNITVDVKVFTPGTSIDITDPIVSGNLTGPFAYSLPPSGSANTVVIRAFYAWPLFVTQLGYNIGNLNGSKRLLSATAAFHVEP